MLRLIKPIVGLHVPGGAGIADNVDNAGANDFDLAISLKRASPVRS
jgi:hypothetical protein